MPLPLLLYLGSIVGAIALLLTMPKRGLNWKPVGLLLGASVLGAIWLLLATQFDFWSQVPGPTPPGFGGAESTGIELPAFAFHYVFGLIGIAGSVMVITNKRPVYAALWFVMVVLSTAGMFLTLEADFIAFAMVIIYGGAILVTYMFVIMLASEQQQSLDVADVPEYERIAREPFAAVAFGFLLLAVLLNIMFTGLPDAGVDTAKAASDNQMVYGSDDPAAPNDALALLTGRAGAERPDTPLTPADAAARDATAAAGPDAPPPDAKLSNVERVGVDLFRSHPLGLELAGIILLVALIGAIVIAKTRVYEEDDHHAPGPPTGPGGATVHPKGEPGPFSPQVVQATGSGKVGQ